MAKVFISCGQRGNERKITEKIATILKKKFHLNSYLAFKVQSLDDVMSITKELRSSDYYLFIDFRRRRLHPEDFAVSLFTHQELALAYSVGFDSMIALCQKGLKREGFINYILSNPEIFTNENDLYEKIKKLVIQKGWAKDFSRNLVLHPVFFSGLINYPDHTGTFVEKVCKIRVYNKRPDRAAVNTICILNRIDKNDSPDKSNLKWAWQIGYSKTILPNGFGDIDLFSIHAYHPGIFLHSLRDFEREAIVSNNGKYKFRYKLFAEGFPLIEFCVSIYLQWEMADQADPRKWNFKTTAKLVR